MDSAGSAKRGLTGPAGRSARPPRPSSAQPGCPLTSPSWTGCAGSPFLRSFSTTASRALRAPGSTRPRCGAGRASILFFVLSGFLDHFDLLVARDKTALLPQFPRPPRAAHLAGLHSVAGRGLPQCPVVHRPHGLGCGAHGAMVGLPLLPAESLSPCAARLPSAQPGRWPSRSSTTLSGLRWSAGCGAPWMLAAVIGRGPHRLAAGALSESKWLWVTPTHTLIKLDGIALGSLLALGLYTLPIGRRAWLWIGLAGLVLGTPRPPPSPAEPASSIPPSPRPLPEPCSCVDCLDGRAQSAERGAPRRGPLAFYGKISYGLYMTPHRGLHLFRLVRRRMDAATAQSATWQSWHSASSPHCCRHCPVVRLRVAESSNSSGFFDRSCGQSRRRSRFDRVAGRSGSSIARNQGQVPYSARFHRLFVIRITPRASHGC